MKIVKNIVSLCVAVTLVSCATEEEKMTRYMTGKWESTYLKLEMPSYQKKDTLIKYDIDYLNPEDPRAKQQGKSYSLHKADGTFETWQEKNGRPVGNKGTGNWRVTKDSLIYSFEQGGQSIVVPFGLKKIEDGYIMTGLQDRDGDGEIDDTFILETVRVPYEPEQ